MRHKAHKARWKSTMNLGLWARMSLLCLAMLRRAMPLQPMLTMMTKRTPQFRAPLAVNEMFTPGGKQQLPIINESDLYSLILSSKLPTAKQFKHWVTSEVLPTIRKHGAYMTPETLQEAITESRCSIWRKSQQQAHTRAFLSPWSVKAMEMNCS